MIDYIYSLQIFTKDIKNKGTFFLSGSSGTQVTLCVASQSGFVGVGTSTAPKRLTVKGDVSASGNFFGKTRHITHHNFSVAATNNTHVPSMGSLLESGTQAVHHRIVAPYNGRLVKVLARGENASGTTLIGIATASNGTQDTTLVDGSQITQNMSSADTTYEFVMSSSKCSFNKGQAYSIMFDSDSASTAGVNLTAVWEYTILD